MDKDKPFLMTIDDIFNLKNRGTVVAGTIKQGVITKGGEVEVGYPGKIIVKTTIAGIEMLNPPPKNWEKCGLLFKGDNIDQIKPGMMIAAPGLLSNLDQLDET
jgi:elongation factor Tu